MSSDRSKVLSMEAGKERLRARMSGHENKKKKKAGSGDFGLVALVAILVVFGIIMVFSASYYYSISENGSPYSYLIRQLVWVTFGMGTFVFFSIFDFKWLKKGAPVIMVASVILLALLFTPLGVTINYATRWLDLKLFTIMPGELAKPACIIFVAAFLSKENGLINRPIKGILPMICLMAVVGGLIAKQPNTSTAGTVIMIIAAMMFVAGIRLLYILPLMGVAAAAFIAFIMWDPDGYRMSRITSVLDPFGNEQDAGYQVVQGLLAMGSGGFFGKGLGKSVQKTLYLPEPQNDFILAIIGEELGFLGLIILLIIYLLLIWKCLSISMRAPDRFSMLVGTGVSAMLAVQVILNVAVVTSLMPPTGIILPFISYGGNATIVFLSCMGMMLNISRHTRKL